MTPADLAEIVNFIRAHRAPDRPLDVVIGGQTPGDDPARDAAHVESYAAAGLTWWIEGLNWMRGPFGQMRSRLRKGPPRL